MKCSKFLLLFIFCSSVVFGQFFGNRDHLKSWEKSKHGAYIKGDTAEKEIYLIFTGGDYSDGGEHILNVLKENSVKASFFFTGDFYRNPGNKNLIESLIKEKHYLGPHSDKHLLYCDWENRDSTLVTKEEFTADINSNYSEMRKFGIKRFNALYFMPPFEWYNKEIAEWTESLGLILVNFTPGTRSNADYTIPSMGKSYVGSKEIYDSILSYESDKDLNGFFLLLHIGTHPERDDKFYYMLDDLIKDLKKRNYSFNKFDLNF